MILERKIDIAGRINVPIGYIRELNLKRNETMYLSLIDKGFILEKPDADEQNIGLVIQMNNSRISIPKDIFYDLGLNYGDKMYIRLKRGKIAYTTEIIRLEADSEYRAKLSLYNEAFEDFLKVLYSVVYESDNQYLTDERRAKIKMCLYVMVKYCPQKNIPQWLREWSKII